MRNRKGISNKYKVGDRVSLFIPPSEKLAKQMGRKPKHLLMYRGPAVMEEVLSNTTYRLEYLGGKYFRCFSELRPYKATKAPINLPTETDLDMQTRKVVVGKYVALCDTVDKEDDHFHLCKVTVIADDKVILQNYATWYTTERPKRGRRITQEVVDEVPLEEVEDFIDHYDVKMTPKIHINKKSIRQLKALGLKHHVLDKTFP